MGFIITLAITIFLAILLELWEGINAVIVVGIATIIAILVNRGD